VTLEPREGSPALLTADELEVIRSVGKPQGDKPALRDSARVCLASSRLRAT